MNQYNIVWVDDDVNNPELRPDRVALIKKDCHIIGFDCPDSFINFIKDNRNNPENVDCIIIDLSMPLGRINKRGKAKRGTSTGQVLLDEISNSRFKETLVVVYTITDNDDVKEYCDESGKRYLNKIDYLSDEFATEIINLINIKREQQKYEGQENG